MTTNNIIDNLLDSFGILEIVHDRFCSSIALDTLDDEKFDQLQAAVADYQRAVTGYMRALYLHSASRARLKPVLVCDHGVLSTAEAEPEPALAG